MLGGLAHRLFHDSAFTQPAHRLVQVAAFTTTTTLSPPCPTMANEPKIQILFQKNLVRGLKHGHSLDQSLSPKALANLIQRQKRYWPGGEEALGSLLSRKQITPDILTVWETAINNYGYQILSDNTTQKARISAFLLLQLFHKHPGYAPRLQISHHWVQQFRSAWFPQPSPSSTSSVSVKSEPADAATTAGPSRGRPTTRKGSPQLKPPSPPRTPSPASDWGETESQSSHSSRSTSPEVPPPLVIDTSRAPSPQPSPQPSPTAAGSKRPANLQDVPTPAKIQKVTEAEECSPWATGGYEDGFADCSE